MHTKTTTSNHWVTCTFLLTIKTFECWFLFPWQCGGGWQDWKAHAKSRRAWLYCIQGDTQEHVWARGCAGMEWDGGSCYLQAGWKYENGISDSPLCWGLNLFLSISLRSLSNFPPQRATHASVCPHFQSQIQLSSPHLLLLTDLVEQLQQGNVSTAFQAQALCGYVSVFYQAFCCINTQTGSTQHALEAKYQHHSSS